MAPKSAGQWRFGNYTLVFLTDGSWCYAGGVTTTLNPDPSDPPTFEGIAKRIEEIEEQQESMRYLFKKISDLFEMQERALAPIAKDHDIDWRITGDLTNLRRLMDEVRIGLHLFQPDYEST